jgi:transcriptional regulator with XRE-family HTH domain
MLCSIFEGEKRMIIGDRLRQLREDQNLSLGDIEKRTGLLRCYISRVENGHTVPAVETLEKFARALEVPMYQLLYEGSETPAVLPNRKSAADNEWGSGGKDARVLARFRHLLSQTDESPRQMLLFMAQRMAKSRSKR